MGKILFGMNSLIILLCRNLVRLEEDNDNDDSPGFDMESRR
jgi:hypothetical protein